MKGILRHFAAYFEYAYVTVYKDDVVLCEGFMHAIGKIMDITALSVKSFHVFEAGDGGVLIDLYT